MSIIKFFSVGNGDVAYIRHNSDSFSIVDCCLNDDNRERIIQEIKENSIDKGVVRFISTHPDEDHIAGIQHLDDRRLISNFYVVKNEATKEDETESFKRYCELRDGPKAYYVSKACKRKWLNEGDEERRGAGIAMLWPDTANACYLNALEEARDGFAFNNISLVARYSLEDGASVMWRGDLETEFMEDIQTDIRLQRTNIVFAAHHSRVSGKIPDAWLEKLLPDVIIIGEAPSRNLSYYTGYNTLTQNSCGDIIMDCVQDKIHFYVSNRNYGMRNWLTDEGQTRFENYIGTLTV